MSIRARLLFLVALAILVPGILVGFRFFQDRAGAIDAAMENLSASARVIAEDLDEKIQGTAQLHFGLARARDLGARDRAACSGFLSAVLEEYPQYTGILTIDPDGSLFCDSLQTGRELDLTDRNYFKAALQSLGGVTIEPAFGRLTGISVLQIAYPARSNEGDLKFVLLASFNLRKFVDYHQRNLKGMEILFFDKAGTVLVWSPGVERAERAGTSIADTELFRLAADAPDGGTFQINGVDDVTRVWTVATTTPEIRDAGLYMAVGVPKGDLVAGANRRLLENIVALALASLLLFGGVWFLAEISIRRQVGRIAAMATELGRGDLNARIPPPHPRGELGELIRVFNGAAESLQQQRAAIDDLNKKLGQSQKMEAVGQLTGGIAHDFNNLLTVILGNAAALSEGLGDNQRLRTLAEMTERAAERGAELTSRLLAFARRQALEPRATDINRQVADMDKLLRRTLGEDIEIKMVQSSNLWNAMVDPGQLESAILNLSINARDAMPGGGRLTIEPANAHLDEAYVAGQIEVEPGEYVMVAVSDSGTGMDGATLERAFEPFFSTKEVGKGSGLGLSMVYGFVKQSNGHVRIYSEAGQGSTVKLYLPRAAAGTDSAERRSSTAAAEGGPEKILLVEDDDLVRDHVARQLSSLGYDVVTARDGSEAIEVLKRGDHFDLLFTDVVMPGGIGGRQLAEAAQKLRPDLPVLFTSGYTENAIVHNGRLDPGVHLLQKPYRKQDLATKVRAVLDEHRISAR
ncbi:MAG: ATP-binding protein [Rhodospirillaceae bacterium]|nr:ATP-binding protein [Rhodospirillaceae bacterium]